MSSLRQAYDKLPADEKDRVMVLLLTLLKHRGGHVPSKLVVDKLSEEIVEVFDRNGSSIEQYT